MANLPLYELELPSGSIYDIRDKRVDNLNNWEYHLCSSAADTPKDVSWDKAGTTITGTFVASADTMYKIYLVPSINGINDIYDEYITINEGDEEDPDYVWEMFGNTELPDMNQYLKNADGHAGGTAGALAYKNSGSVSVPSVFSSTFSGTASTISVAGTPIGTVSQPTFSGAAATIQTSGIPNGSVTSSFSGTLGTVNVSGTPTAAATTFKGGYTPAGTVSIASAGGTTTIKNPAAKTVVTDMSVSAPAASTATGELLYCEVDGTKLVLKKLIETNGDSITTSDVTVKNGDASYSFSGTASTVSVGGTPTINATTFSGSYTPAGTVSSTFSGAATTFSGSYTPTGTVSQPTFTGATLTSTGAYTPVGTVNTTATETSKTVTFS